MACGRVIILGEKFLWRFLIIMKVILKSDVSKLGKAGDLIEVSDGYARNFLLPKDLAIEATPTKLNEWKNEQARLKKLNEKLHAEALEIKSAIQDKIIKISAKTGDNGKLFGSITNAQIAEELMKQHGLKDFDKKNLKLDETVKTPGDFKLVVKLFPGVQADMILKVEAAE